MNKLLIIGIGLLIVFTGCSMDKQPKTADGLFSRSEKYMHENNYVDAIKDLRTLVKKYPEHGKAPQAQLMLGKAFMSHANDFNQALTEFRSVVENYHESPYAVQGQFMIGYLYANHIKDFNSAKAEFEKFLEEYSERADMGLVESAKFELENLGKDLHEISELQDIGS